MVLFPSTHFANRALRAKIHLHRKILKMRIQLTQSLTLKSQKAISRQVEMEEFLIKEIQVTLVIPGMVLIRALPLK